MTQAVARSSSVDSGLDSQPPVKLRRPANGPASIGKLLIGLFGMVLVATGLTQAFLYMGVFPEYFGNKITLGLIALVLGVGGAAALFFFLNMFIEGLPQRLSAIIMPYAYVLPGLALITLMLLYPTILTIIYSFRNSDSTEGVGLQNYSYIFGNSEFRTSMLNNLLWLLIVPAAVVAIGVVVAVLADKLSARGEKATKSLIFLPMAISFVGAAAIWGKYGIYAYRPPGAPQTGPLNAIWTALGGQPQAWLDNSTLHVNSMLMMVILIWLQVGFAMVLLSSAIKGVPEETLEAARIDGASEWKIFWQVIIPQVKGTIITVFVTVLIVVLKVFDIVYVLTNGRNQTNVIANLFFNELFANDQAGRASAIVVVLLIAITPVLIYQVRHFRREDAR
jgi:alpha-glucoside transport system permease protein